MILLGGWLCLKHNFTLPDEWRQSRHIKRNFAAQVLKLNRMKRYTHKFEYH